MVQTKNCDKNRGTIGLSLFWGFVGLGDILRGEKGERKNYWGSPNLSTQPDAASAFCLVAFLSSM